MNSLAIITARGGSKRIPRKNIKLFCGKPILQYSIEAALDSGCFDQVMVSTEDAEIAEIAREAGAAVPFLRSNETSDDYATTADVIREVLEEYRKRGMEFTHACILYPTAPFVSAGKLREAMKLLVEQNADSVLPMVRFSFPPQRAFVMNDGKISFAQQQYAKTRSQDLEPMYHDSGQFCCFRTDVFLEKKTLVTENTLGIEYPESEVQDIDTPEDWKLAELKYTLMKEKQDVLSN
ncbi:MAG: pseudaminic acid cytidylyltransferase [Acetatifactor sp.]